MKKQIFILKSILLPALFGGAFLTGANGFQVSRQIKQSPEVIEAYDVCRRFQELLGENLDFSNAYEAAFTKDKARRRAIAIIEGELGSGDFKGVSDELLVEAYKQRMQIFYLMAALAAAKDKAPVPVFPDKFEEMLKRAAPPPDAKSFPKFVSQLKKDTQAFRAHFDDLVARYPALAEEVQKFKTGLLAGKFEPPATYEVLPMRGYYRSQVLKGDEHYYAIDGYSLIKEHGHMKIIGIRFFTRLF